MNSKLITYGVIAVLFGAAIFLAIKWNEAAVSLKHIQAEQSIWLELREAELKTREKAALDKIKDSQAIIDSLYMANKKDSVFLYKRTKYYENEIKKLKSITTAVGVDKLTDSILRANGFYRQKR